MKWHFCAVWWQAEKSKILVGRIRVKTSLILIIKRKNIHRLQSLILLFKFLFWVKCAFEYKIDLTVLLYLRISELSKIKSV